MSVEKIEKKVSVRVETHTGSGASATVQKDGKAASAEGGTAQEALDKAADKAKS